MAVINQDAGSSILFSSGVVGTLQEGDLSHRITFTSSVTGTLMRASASNAITFSAYIATQVKLFEPIGEMTFTSTVSRAGSVFNRSITHALRITQGVGQTKTGVASNSMTFSQTSERMENVEHSLTFTQSVQGFRGQDVAHSLTFTQSVTSNASIFNPVASTAIVFLCAALGWLEKESELCTYNPIKSADTLGLSQPTSTAPSRTQASTVTLVCGADNITIRSPRMGNQESFNKWRSINTLKGGALKVYTDSTWPTKYTLKLSFTVCLRSEAQDFLTFMYACLGAEITWTDYEGRSWTGVLVDIEDPLIQNGRQNFDFSITFIGEPT